MSCFEHCSNTCLEIVNKITKISLRIAFVPVEIRTRYFANASQSHYWLSQFAWFKFIVVSLRLTITKQKNSEIDACQCNDHKE